MNDGFSKAELRSIFGFLARLRPPGGRPLGPDEIVTLNELIATTERLITTSLGRVERGALIFAWRIEPELAPTMNELAQWNRRQPWRHGKTKDALAPRIRELIEQHPTADLCGAQKQRWVRVTRFTPAAKLVDESAIDVIGGKMPIDMLRRAGVFVDDSPRWLIREARVEKCKRGETHVFVEVFEVADDRVDTPEPAADPRPVDARSFGPMTQAILGEDARPGERPRVLPFGDA